MGAGVVMYPEFAVLIVEGRARLGIDQAELGRRVGVGQQTVSRWERGQGRPKRSVATTVAGVLSVDIDEVLAAAGYAGATADSASEALQAVRPLVRGLPIHELAPDRFEDLSTEIAQQLHPEGHASRFGGPGEKQQGIDVLVDGARQATVQCKRHRQFGPQDVRKVVTDTEIEAPMNYLFLSRQTATAAARSEMTKYPRWELWDGEDIARFIRTRMTMDAAVRLVDTYFPNHRESFLGVARPGPWAMANEFFAPASGDQIFTHDWALAGRISELADLLEAIRAGRHGIARLVGRGGLGKTRLLRSVAEAFETEKWVVRFLPYGAKADPEDFELLTASGPSLVIIDDGHERSDIAEILSHLRRRNSDTRLLIAMRPYGEVGLSQDLRRAGILLSELSTTTLADLTQDEGENLAREALGGAHEALVQRLAHLTLDCPLATVVGGVLIRRGRLDPADLEQDDEIRTEILRGFRDAIVADSLDGEFELRRAVVEALSALQPFRSVDPAFQNTLSKLVGAPYDRAQHHLRSLEDAGVLLRRGESLRLVPDLLGDVVLAQACFDERSGTTTGFLARLVEAATGDTLSHVFVNASRVDWQVRQHHTTAPSPASALWEALEKELEATDIHGRRGVLHLLKRVAYFQPERTLELTKWILSHPTDEVRPQDQRLANLYPPKWDDVLHDIPPVLQTVAYHFDSMSEACEMLWQLAQLDQRPTNQHPEHPLRVLRDLAEFGVSRPIEYNEAIIDIASRWFADGQQLSPFDVLEPLLATEGSAQSYSDYTISFRPYALNLNAVLPVRQRVINLALNEIRSPDLRRAASGVHAIENAFRFPVGSFGRVVSPEERAAWAPNFVSTINELGPIVAEPTLDPAIAVAIMKALHWHAEYAEGSTQTAANAVLALVPDTTIFQLSLLLHDGWGHLVRSQHMSFQESDMLRDEHREAVVRLVLAEYDNSGVARVLERRLQVEQEAFGPGEGNPGPMVAAMVEARPEVANAIVQRVIDDPESSLGPVLPVVLGRLGDVAPAELVKAAKGLLALQVPAVDTFVSRSFGWNRGLRSSLVEGELELIRTFAANPDPSIRQSAIIAAQRIAPEHPQAAVNVLGSVSFRDAPQLADEIFAPLAEVEGPLRWDLMSMAQQAAINAELVEIVEVDGYHLFKFLSQRSATHPHEVIDLFRSRILNAEALETLGAYQPTPFHWDVPLRIRAHSDFLPILRELRDWIGESDSWVRRENGARLFTDAAGGFDDAVLALLKEGLAGAAPASVDGVAAILRKAPRRIVYSEVPFVLDALDAAARFGEDCEQTMREALWAAIITGSRSGTPGEPFPADVQQRDECAQIAETLPKGSRGEDFYRALSESAEGSIRWTAESHTRDDRRDW
jgi:transcriptional regulator with XRE-family HTH domain